jgi:tripartite-type tricarboxylate transporter receptor subunit TctC
MVRPERAGLDLCTRFGHPSAGCGQRSEAGMRRRFTVVLILAMTLGFAGAAPAQQYPNRAVRVIVPWPPGQATDLAARLVAQKLQEALGQPFVADNRPGAGGSIGSDVVAKAPPDGYTLLIISVSYAMNAALHKLPYDPVTSFAPVAQIGIGPSVLAVTPSLPVNSVRQLIALARAKPGQLNYASAGVGGVNHFSGELFKLATRTDIVHVPYKGGTPAMTDVMAGQVGILFNALTSALTYIRSGRLKPLGVGSLKRTPALPDTPAIAETVPGYESIIWWGIQGPAGMPPAIVAKLNAEIGAILREPETIKRLEADAAQPVVVSAETFARLIADDVAKWIKVAKASGIKAQ